MLHPNYGPSTAYTAEEIINLRAHYAAEAELVDRWIGRVLQKIDDLGLWQTSVVAITSDHGFSIGEHARCGKSNIHPSDRRYWPLYPEVSHVPFLLAAPQVQPGSTFDFTAQPQDILPSLADLAGAGVDPPEQMHGSSFAGVLRGTKSPNAGCAISGGFVRNDVLAPGAITPFLTTGRWGYAPVGSDGSPELYDLEKDPGAHTNVVDGNEATVREVHQQFIQGLRDLRDDPGFLSMWSDAEPPR